MGHRVGTVELDIPKLRAGTYFPSLLEPRVAPSPGAERRLRSAGLGSGSPCPLGSLVVCVYPGIWLGGLLGVVAIGSAVGAFIRPMRNKPLDISLAVFGLLVCRAPCLRSGS